MITIHKYSLRSLDMQDLYLPKGATVLALDVQWDTPCLWARFDTNTIEKERWKILRFGTGWDASESDGMVYLGTVVLDGGSSVWHFFMGPASKEVPMTPGKSLNPNEKAPKLEPEPQTMAQRVLFCKAMLSLHDFITEGENEKIRQRIQVWLRAEGKGSP